MTALVVRANALRLPLADQSVDLIVTSPPYWALRAYATGGHPAELGSEATPRGWLAALWAATSELARVLKPSGSIFANLGDVYADRANTGPSAARGSSDGTTGRAPRPSRPQRFGVPRKSLYGLPWAYALGCTGILAQLTSDAVAAELARVLLRDLALGWLSLAEAEAVVDAAPRMGGPDPGLGLILRAELVWSKPNSLPESVRDRARRTHETWLHLVKTPRYYAAVDELREPHTGTAHPQKREPVGSASGNGMRHRTFAGNTEVFNPLGKLPGSVWTIPTEPLQVPARLGVDHSAAFPSEWPRRLILGWSPPGICVDCGQGRFPVARIAAIEDRRGRAQGRQGDSLAAAHGHDGRAGERYRASVSIAGYACACTPYTDDPGTGEPSGQPGRYGNVLADESGYPNTGQGWGGKGGLGDRSKVGPWREYHLDQWHAPPTRPAVVLDPFCGTGTTVMVARALGRVGIGVDLSADYCRLARWRVFDSGHAAKALARTWAERQTTLADMEGAQP